MVGENIIIFIAMRVHVNPSKKHELTHCSLNVLLQNLRVNSKICRYTRIIEYLVLQLLNS